MVFLNDANLFNVFKKGYTDIEEMKQDVKEIGEAVDLEALQEALQSSILENTEGELF